MRRLILRLIIIPVLIAVSVISCKKDDTGPDYDYFVSSELTVTYSAATIGNMIDAGLELYPGLADLKPYFDSDVNVYRFVYTTEVMGEEIQASGLVSVPVNAGEYPVLSFQNGTNTVNEYAPSEYVINPSYQLIEFIASMGFVVVIPDYPGFGESSHIPHPYLVTEPTVASVVDMLYALQECCSYEFPGIILRNEYYLLGYSQGGWATLNLHKAFELDYSDDFNLAGTVCGAGPYNMSELFMGMLNTDEYPMPSYLGYILNAYSYYEQFTNTVCDIMKEPYCQNLGSLYSGILSTDEINEQLTTTIADLFTADFLGGFEDSPVYSSVREALVRNSVSPWHTMKPLLFVHGSGDTHVSVTATEMMYDRMIEAGTSTDLCSKIIYPDLDHNEAVVPSMTDGLLFLLDLNKPID